MSIVKTHRDTKYFKTSALPFEDPSLSYKAKGILAYVMSRPPGWELRTGDFIRRSTDGKKSVRSGIQELIQAGYAKYIIPRNERGDFLGKELHVRETLDLPWPH